MTHASQRPKVSFLSWRKARPAAALLLAAPMFPMLVAPAAAQEAQMPARCDPGNGGITLSPGFCATVFADKIGHARHMAVAPDGTVYVNTWSGRYYGDDRPPAGGFLVALQDTKGSGHADKIVRFGPAPESGGTGGTGIGYYNGALYAEAGSRIVRYALKDGEIVPPQPPETIVSGLPITGDHPMHPFKIDAQGNLYMDSGSATNACQRRNRIAHSPGIDPCTELETRGGT
jgi:glucose/arabinose dehydrogenase